MKAETLYIPLSPTLSARVTVEIREEPLPTPGERPVKRAPSARELHLTAERLLQRVYQFHPVDGHE